MDKVDLKAERRDLYAPPRGRFVDVDVPMMRFLAVDGTGNPNTSESYLNAIEALFAASYAAKFACKRVHGRDYVVMPLEGLWWAEDMRTFQTREKDAWSWRMLIRQPDWLADVDIADAVAAARSKGADAEGRLRTVELGEGRCVQTLHVGSYDDEGPTLGHLHDELLPSRGLRENGMHHENT
jgi:hypothetical protein